MIVAFHIPHNEGIVYGIFTKPNLDTGLLLVDLYEVDGQIKTFENVDQARDWLAEDHVRGVPPLVNVELDKVHQYTEGY